MIRKLLLFSLFALLTNTILHAYDAEIDGIYYNFFGNNAEVTSTDEEGAIDSHGWYNSSQYSGTVVIPESVTYNGKNYSVTSIGEAAFYSSDLTLITIPNSVTSIGEAAFSDCHFLPSITIPNSVTSIGGGAFSYCDRLTSITISNGVTNIGDNTFMFCTSLISVTIGNCVTSIGSYAFHCCRDLTFITLPESLTSIGYRAFSDCEITSITLPNSVTSIGNEAFCWCESLTSVVSKIQEPFALENSAFSGISSNCVLTVPAGTRDAYIAAGWTEDIFQGGIVEDGTSESVITFADATVKALCVANWDTNGDGELSKDEAGAVTDLGEVFSTNEVITSFNELQYFTGLTSISVRAFYGCSSLNSIILPNSVTYIGDSAFYDCGSLKYINISNSVTSIGDNAFKGCGALITITIPENVTSIGGGAFEYCDDLISIMVETGNSKYDSRGNCNAIIETSSNTLIAGCMNTTIPEGVTSINDFAFEGCSYLASITLPESVTSIGEEAFYNCSRLTSVVPKIQKPFAFGNNAFSNISSYCVLTIPLGTRDAYIAAGWTTSVFKSVIEDSPNIVFADVKVKSLCLANWDTNGDGELSEAEAAAVTDLGTVFYGNKEIGSFNELQYFTGLNSIGEEAFRNCSGLTSVTIPGNVTGIGEYAFYNCSSLTSVNIPEQVISIGQAAFRNCSCLTSVTIPENVTSIGTYAFYNCSSMTSINIPEGVTSIGERAFYGCSGLTSITIPEGVTSIGNYAFYNCGSLTSVVSKIQEPFAFGNKAFSNISTNCVLTIPAGTRNAYNTAGWTEDIFQGGIVEDGAPEGFNNNKLYALTCKRGGLALNDDATGLAAGQTRTEASEADKRFAIITYEGAQYLYSPVNKQYLLYDGSFVNRLGSPITFDDSQADGEYKFMLLTQNNAGETLCFNNNGDIVINGWDTADDGNRWLVEPVADFDPTEALALAEAQTFTVTYNVTFDGNIVATATEKVASGSALPPVPATLNNDFVTLTKTGTHPTTVTEDVTVTYTAEWNGPFEFTKTETSAKWYNMHIRNGYYVSKKETEPYYPAQVDEATLATLAYQWAFGGDPYHVKVYNRTTGLSETLTKDGENAVMRSGDYTWDLLSNSDGFVLRITGTEHSCINQYGGINGPLQFWDDVNSPTDDGSTFRVEEAMVIELPDYVINDETTSFNIEAEATGKTVEFTHAFNGEWEALYLPFAIDYDAIKADFDLAEIDGIVQNDDDNDGIADFTVLSIMGFREQMTTPNTPYLIRAKKSGMQTINFEDVTVYPTTIQSIDCSSTSTKYEFTGSYNTLNASALTERYIVQSGELVKGASSLAPCRWYMTATARKGRLNLPAKIRIMPVEDVITGVSLTLALSKGEGDWYDLSGRKLSGRPARGIYIEDGKKVLLK